MSHRGFRVILHAKTISTAKMSPQYREIQSKYKELPGRDPKCIVEDWRKTPTWAAKRALMRVEGSRAAESRESRPASSSEAGAESPPAVAAPRGGAPPSAPRSAVDRLRWETDGTPVSSGGWYGRCPVGVCMPLSPSARCTKRPKMNTLQCMSSLAAASYTYTFVQNRPLLHWRV